MKSWAWRTVESLPTAKSKKFKSKILLLEHLVQLTAITKDPHFRSANFDEIVPKTIFVMTKYIIKKLFWSLFSLIWVNVYD